MCILIGYQGVGKSTLAGKNNFIDLESSNFKYNGNRCAYWNIIYCNIALDLSKQGYKVFTSSHKEVRDTFATNLNQTPIYTITPDISLKNDWINKLGYRYSITKLHKDYCAWENAKKYYEENIKDILACPFEHIIIESMDYDLEDILYNIDKKGLETDEAK